MRTNNKNLLILELKLDCAFVIVEIALIELDCI